MTKITLTALFCLLIAAIILVLPMLKLGTDVVNALSF